MSSTQDETDDLESVHLYQLGTACTKLVQASGTNLVQAVPSWYTKSKLESQRAECSQQSLVFCYIQIDFAVTVSR